jgi:CBS-domain-containing membrane protein
MIWTIVFHRRINALPIVDDTKKLVGIISKEDLLQSLYPDYSEMLDFLVKEESFEATDSKMKNLLQLTGKELMQTKVIFAYDDTPVMRALSRMISQRVNQLPVLNSEKEVIGMVTKGDIFSALFKKHLRRWHKRPKK